MTAKTDIEQFQKEIKELEVKVTEEIDVVEDKWAEIASQQSEISVQPYKKDIRIPAFGIAWLPYYKVEAGGRQQLIPATSL